MANLLSAQYSSVFSKPTDSPYFAMVENVNSASITDIDFTEQDIIDAIDELKNTLSSGPDGLAAIFLKKCKTSLSKPLYYLWRKCLDQGITPCKLKDAHIIPIHKGGSMDDLNNYRPISLLSIFDKLIEKLMHKQLYEFLEKNNVLFKNQYGFRKRNNTTYAVLEMVEKIKETIDTNGCGIFIDLRKAFDTVNHQTSSPPTNYVKHSNY